jgi:hypothetical protein
MSTTTMPTARSRLPAAAPVPVEQDGAVRQGGLTVITRILPGRTTALRALLNRMDTDPAAGTDVESNPVIPFMALTRVHFARWLIFDEATDVRGRTIPASLVFETNYDEPFDDHLAELVDVAGAGLDLIYEHCSGYPPPGQRSADAVMRYLRSHRVRVNTFYNGTYGKSVDQIRREAGLRVAIGEFLDARAGELSVAEPAAVRAAVQDFVRGRADLTWALQPPRRTRPPFPGPTALRIGGVLLVLGVIAGLVLATRPTLIGLLALAAVLGAWLLAIRFQEGRDDATAWTEKHRPLKPELAGREDRVVQNQLSSVINIKPGVVRWLTQRVVLAVIDRAARHVFYQGSLGSIPSIHFARWVIVDDGRRLAFFSNFDGSWESYLGEFVDRASTGLTAVWSNCVAFPRTRWLVREGAAHEQQFKAYARDSQTVTNVWYSAYKTLTVLNITNNSEIRKGLNGRMSDRELSEWLRRL